MRLIYNGRKHRFSRIFASKDAKAQERPLALGPLAVRLALTRPACAGCSWIEGVVVLRRGALLHTAHRSSVPQPLLDLGGYDRSLLDAIKRIQRHSKDYSMKWHHFCDKHHHHTKDPAAHSDSMLHAFIASLQL